MTTTSQSLPAAESLRYSTIRRARATWQFLAYGEGRVLAALVAGFTLLWLLPVDSTRLSGAIHESLALAHDYARDHVVLCLVPAFFIAGAISSFVSQASVLRYLGPLAPKPLAYGVASVSGSVLAVCSCTVLPLFAGIYSMGAGLGPAAAFLYSGPAINVLAVILTARVLGFEIGAARAVGAVTFSVVIGVLMAFIFRREEARKATAAAELPIPAARHPLWQNTLLLASMLAILVFANWSTAGSVGGFFAAVFALKWWLTGASSLLLAALLVATIDLRVVGVVMAAVPALLLALLAPDRPVYAFVAGIVGLIVLLAAAPEGSEAREWLDATWSFAKQVTPLLLGGVLLSGLLLGRPGHEALVPSTWITSVVGGNSLAANLFAAVSGALMYFATLTEVPIVQGLVGSGMGHGPSLTLLLAGPALSLPSILVLRSIMGTRKTLVYTGLIVVLSALTGWVYGSLF